VTSQLPRIELPRRETLPEQVARRLLDYLLAGHIRPGGKMPSERQLAQALGVGRSVVREALKSLGLLGIVEVRQGDGTYLKGLESDLLPRVIEWGLLLGERRAVDLVEARLHLETITARLAAQRRDENDLAEIRMHLEKMRQADGNAADFVAADVAFHLAVARAARNTVFSDVLTSVQSLLHVWITRVIEDAGDTGPSFEEHIPVYQAVLDGDGDAAAAARGSHLGAAAGRLERALAAEKAVAEQASAGR
jgi:GntR family transcriptional repressor for pyruvate dehydrogenase complex